MSDAPRTLERYELILERLITAGMEIALDLQEDFAQSEDRDQKARISRAFDFSTRGVRQSLLLLERLQRDTRRAEREARDDALAQDKLQRLQRLNAVRAPIARAIDLQAEGYEAIALSARLTLALSRDHEAPDFLTIPTQRHIQRLCQQLGLELPPEPAADEPATDDMAVRTARLTLARTPFRPPCPGHLSAGRLAKLRLTPAQMLPLRGSWQPMAD